MSKLWIYWNNPSQFSKWTALERVLKCSLSGVIIEWTSRGSCTYRLLILHLLDAQVLQWDDSSWLFVLDKCRKCKWQSAAQEVFFTARNLSCTHCGVLKVVQTVVCEDEPPPLPGFNSSPCGAKQPASDRLSKGEKGRERRAPSGAADRQTDVWADRQMTAPEDSFYPEDPANHPDPPSHHALTITTVA